MNIIQIVTDTFRRDFLKCYGNDWIHTEHIDEFAKDSLVFDRAYVASFPTGPMRQDLYTGRYIFTYPEWSDKLSKDEIILPQVLSEAGYTTMLIVDNPHMLRSGNNFERGFDGFWWIRGQEFDPYITAPSKEVKKEKYFWPQYLKNKRFWTFEEDYPVAQSMNSAMKWLEFNYNQHEKFYLHIETFDPHEPWDPPRWYADLYNPDWKSGDVMGVSYHPKHSGKELHSAANKDLNRLRALYAGNVTMVDRWVGGLLQKIKDLGLLENTVVIFTSDHGTHLGEHGYIHKRGYGGVDPIYEEVSRVPLIVRLPDSMGKISGRSEAIVQFPDLMPTILDTVGVKIPETVQGKSFLPIIRGEDKEIHEVALSCGALIKPPHRITVTSKEWAFIPVNDDTDQTDDLGRKLEPELYHLPTDPQQTQNVYNEKEEVVERMYSKMFQFLEHLGVGEKILHCRRDSFPKSFFEEYASYDHKNDDPESEDDRSDP